MNIILERPSFPSAPSYIIPYHTIGYQSTHIMWYNTGADLWYSTKKVPVSLPLHYSIRAAFRKMHN